MKQFLLLGMAMLIGMTSHHVQGQMIIDTWGFTTGVDTTLWMDLGADYTVLFSTTNGTQNHASSGLRDIGFPFTLGATTHTKFSTNVNGTVRLGAALLPNGGYIAEPLGQNINAGPRIDALGRAGMIDTGCYMRSAVLGDSGSRVLVVEARLREYADMGSAESHYVHFQVQLFEAGGLRIVYGQVDSGAIYGSTQNGVAATGSSSNKDVIFFDFAAQRAVRFNGNCTLRNAAEDFPTRGRWYMLAPNPTACPRATASTVWVTNYSAAGVELTQSTTDAHNYRLRVSGTDIDTLWNAGQATFTLPPLNPRTDYTLSLQTLCGEDTSYIPFSITITTGCGAVVRLPWSTAFPSLSHSDCWDMPYVSGNNADFTRRWRQTSTTTDVYCPGAAGTYNSWLISPVVYLPDGDGLTLQWDYRALLSSAGVAPHVELRVAPCAEDGTAADGAWSTLMVLDGEYQSYTALAANLDAWRGQRVRVAWVRTGEGGGSAYVDNVSLYRQQEPRLLREVPSVAFAGDTTLYTARMFTGVDSNVVYTWHSSLLDSTIATTDSMVSVVYPNAGIDTVTVVLSNAYGSDTATAVVEVDDCRTVTTLPWSENFMGSYACWTIDGWQRASSTLSYNENGDLISHDNVMYPNNTGKYMLTQPVTIPATGVEHLSLWAEADGPLMVRVSPTASTDTASYTDTLLTVPNSSRIEIFWRTAGLAAYAGQTVRFGFFKTAGTQALVSRVKVDYDTLPALGNMVVPAISRTDSTIACSVELLRGAGEGLTYTWHSSLMDTTWVGTGANGSHGFNVTYTIGGTDTITVVAANAYGSDTMVRTVQVMDCRPVTALPWREDFDDDLTCWYLTQNATYHRWLRSQRSSAPYYINDYYAYSQCNFSESLTTPADAWLVSRAITIPADTALAVRLFWQVGISSGNNLTNNYRVMVSTAADCTDTTAYEELYHDTLPLPNQTNLAQRSVSLTPYAGQTIYIAFRNQPLVRRATALMIDKVEVRETTKPRLLLAADNEMFYHGDTATFTATLQEGSDSNLVYTWHSSLLDSTWVDTAVGGQWRLTYGMTGGMDTVTLVATNAYGSDTAMVCISSVIDSLPSISHIAHGAAFVGDTTEYTVVDNRSVVTGQTYTWHSTLLDTTIVLQSSQAAFRLVYTAEGNDTVTVVKSNVFGSSTSSAVVAVGSHPLPEVALTIPARVEVGVAAEFAALINDCSANGRAFTWHSTLLDTTVATLLPTLALMYETEGTDTLTVIASNAYGADTAVTVFEVVDCSARAIPYTEDFEGVAPTASDTLGELPACWNLGWNGSNAAYGPHVITTGGYQYISNIPDNALFLVAGSLTGYGNTAEVSLPRMADSLQNLSLAFDYRFESSSYGTLTVGYYNANNFFTTVKTMPAHNGSYRRDTVSFAAATVPDAAMVLRWYHGSSWYAVVIDNIEVITRDTLPVVRVEAPAQVVVGDSVHLSATLNDCLQNGLVFNWHSSLLDTTITLNSSLLTLNYTAGGTDTITLIVSNAYGADTAVAYIYVVDCGNITLPYTEDFEAVAPAAYNVAGNLPDCWESFINSAFTYLAPHVITTGSYNYISDIPDHALLMVSNGTSSSASGHTSTALLPRFAGGLGSLALVLDHRHENATHGTLTVGYYDEALDTFHPVDTLTPQVGSYCRDTVSFSTVTDTSVRMALQWTDNYNAFWGVAIDNIEVYTNDAPQQLTVIAVTPQCVSLRWAATDSATAYVVGLAGLGDTVVSDTTVTFCGLAEGTDYTVGVAAIMGSDTGHYAHASFHTPLLCAPVLSASVEVDGNNIVVGWQHDTTGYSAATGAVVTLTDLENGSVRIDTVLGVTTALYAGTAYHRYAVGVQTLCGTAISGSNMDTVQMAASVCYQIRGTRSENYRFINGYSSYNYNQMLYPATAVGSVDTLYGIAFRVSGQTSTYTRATDIYLGHTTATTLASPVSADSLTQVADNYPYSIADTGWSSIMFDTPFVYDGTSNLIVTMVDVSGIDAPYNPGTGMHAPQTGEAYLYYSKVYQSEPIPDPYTLNFTAYTHSWIPDIRLLGGCNYGQCLSPEPMVTSTGVSSITLAWTERGIEDLWQVEYRSDASDPWTVAGTTGATTYTLAGLAPATVYQLRVASLCSGDTLHSYILTSHTACDTVQLPYHADFTLGTQPCWIEGGYYGNSFSGIRLYGLPNYYPRDSIVSPVIGGSLSDVKVTIRAQNPNNDSYYSNYSASLAVGACNADGSGIVWVDTVDFNERQVVEEHTVHFSHYNGTARNIIIRVLGAIADVESVSIDLFSGCLPVHDVRIVGLTDSEATVQWMPEDASHSFAVYLDGTLQGIASGTNYVLTGLAADSQYTATVREICTAGDTAEAIACTFRTACTALSLPVFEDFDYAAIYDEEPGLPDCWTSLFYDHTATAYGIYSDGYYTCMQLNTSDYADSTVGNFAVSPLMNVGPGGATVRFKGQTVWTGPVTVGVMTNVSDTATFIPCLTVTHNNYGLQWYQFNTDTMVLPDVWAFAIRFGRNRIGTFDSLYVEANPVPTHSLSLAVNDTTMGSVSGAGTYEEGTNVTITATANEGYHFATWSDGITASTRTVKVDFDTSFTAFFAPDTLWHIVTVGASNDGACQTYGSGTYIHGDTIEIGYHLLDTASAGGYWEILGWNDGNADNPRQVVVTSDTIFTLLCQWVGDSVGINDAPEVNNRRVNIYPNPATTTVRVECEGWNAETATLLDLNGRVVSTQTIQQSNSQAIILDISMLPRGTYFLRLTDGTTTAIRKLILQ